MRIAVFGATGGLGSKFMELALAKGNEIIAYVRSPEKIKTQQDNLEVIEGDVFDKEKVVESLSGVDAVLITWRLRGQRVPLFSEGTQNVIAAMKKNNVKRIIVISEYAYGEHFRNLGFFTRTLIKLYSVFARFQQKERKQQDEIIHNSGLDWTIDRIRMLTNKENDRPLEVTSEPKNNMQSIYRGTAADKILFQLENPAEYLQKDLYF